LTYSLNVYIYILVLSLICISSYLYIDVGTLSLSLSLSLSLTCISSYLYIGVGTRGRTAPHRLDHHLEDDEDDIDLDMIGSTSSYSASTNKPQRSSSSQSDDNTEHYVITTEPVGEILALSIAVRHRHLTDEWYLRYVVLSDPERIRVRHFPCQNVVLSKTTLRSGEGE
jgi:multisubunit Na+/H+ antiporter MnhC subunit